jgi:DNA-binding NarL/FixJ family response regulator
VGTMIDKIRVMLVDDHAVVRVGFRMLIDASSDLCVVDEAESGEIAYQRYPESRPHVVVGDRVPNQASARVLYRDGIPIATLVGGQFMALEAMDEAAEWAARSRLLRAQSEYAVAESGD